jgi:membrane protein DedA with SNARE-associated domain
VEEFIQSTFMSLAYNPIAVYAATWAFMLASAVGFPLPEEVVLVSSGFIAHFALFPDTPHPPDAHVVNIHIMAWNAFVAVIVSDFLIYWLGKRLGPRAFELKIFRRMVSEERLTKVRTWMQKYGYWPVIVFRFTPGVRFPGHLMCGAMGLSPVKFLAVDAFAALISVPTQIYFVGYYGREILKYFQTAKIYLFSALAIGLVIFIYRRWKEKQSLAATDSSGS